MTDQTRRLAPVAGGTAATVGHDTFTDLAFETGASVALLNSRHAYVAAVSGCVYHVDCAAHRLDAVYQLHAGAINSVAVSEGFAITGSDDKALRVWPLDFTDFFLEAEHEAPVTSVATSADGLQVRACAGGSLFPPRRPRRTRLQCVLARR